MAQGRLRVYRWWPAFQPTAIEVSDRGTLARHFVNVAIITVALCLPPVTRATGISAGAVLGIILAHVVWMIVLTFGIRPSEIATPLRFHVSLAGSLVLNAAITVAFPALGDDPRTPLWMLPVMYACFNGSIQELEPSLGVLFVHVGAPLLAIPLLLARGGSPGWSVAAPLLCSAISAVGYNHLAVVSARWRELRREQDEALAALRAKLDEDDSTRLARDLHDSLGSSLAIVGLYGDLIERHVARPDQLRSIASMVRDAAREGTTELSALMDAMTPASADVHGLAATVVETGRRAAEASGVEIDVRVVNGGEVLLDGAVRLALVRVFQEALHNSLEHGAARRVDVRFAADEGSVSIEVVDDGTGFTPADGQSGRGLPGMRARAAELGGTFSLTSSPGSGARVFVELPCSPRPRPRPEVAA